MEKNGFLEANVANFSFTTLNDYITERETNGTIADVQDGGNTVIHVRLTFTWRFDGTEDGLFRWLRFVQRLSEEYGVGLRT